MPLKQIYEQSCYVKEITHLFTLLTEWPYTSKPQYFSTSYDELHFF